MVEHTKLKILSREMPADLETPVSAFLKLQTIGAKILLESVEGATRLGRYSFIGMKPESKITVYDNHLSLQNGVNSESLSYIEPDAPLSCLRSILNRSSVEEIDNRPPLLGGAVGFISYDFIRFFENIPNLSRDTLHIPPAMLYLIDTLLVFDHIQRTIKVLSLAAGNNESAAAEKLDSVIDALHSPLANPSGNGNIAMGKKPASNFAQDDFCRAVSEVQRHIIAGDVYQQVISQRLEGETDADPFMIYRALRMLNPSPYMYFLDFDDVKLIGSSPEALVRLENGIATVRPIAGTRPRGHTAEEDNKMAEELLNDAKERAEHVMLVDLGRNDLGRCCRVGSVNVNEFMTIERYSHVMHMTSNITGKLRKDMDQFDLFKAAFPAGTVTGAPKIKSMELIENIETTRRGPYAGAVGYFSLSGDMDWCINIRTILMKVKKYYLQAGAGIVADSIPEMEYLETKNKIAALQKAIENAEGGL
ncbi:MAG: anthranilate synthase component I [Candidatus Zixiibacteriota bacterium]